MFKLLTTTALVTVLSTAAFADYNDYYIAVEGNNIITDITTTDGNGYTRVEVTTQATDGVDEDGVTLSANEQSQESNVAFVTDAGVIVGNTNLENGEDSITLEVNTVLHSEVTSEIADAVDGLATETYVTDAISDATLTGEQGEAGADAVVSVDSFSIGGPSHTGPDQTEVTITGTTTETTFIVTDGADGADGRIGVDGDKGDRGQAGATGATGAQGAKGEKGDKGDDFDGDARLSTVEADLQLKATIAALATMQAELTAAIEAAETAAAEANAATAAAVEAADSAAKAEAKAIKAAAKAAKATAKAARDAIANQVVSLEDQWKADKVVINGDISELKSKVSNNTARISKVEGLAASNSNRLDAVEATLADHETRIFDLENPVDNEDADDKLWTSLMGQVSHAKHTDTPTYFMTQKGPIDLRGVSTVAVAGGKVSFAMSKTYAYDVMGWKSVWVRG